MSNKETLKALQPYIYIYIYISGTVENARENIIT